MVHHLVLERQLGVVPCNRAAIATIFLDGLKEVFVGAVQWATLLAVVVRVEDVAAQLRLGDLEVLRLHQLLIFES